MNFLAHAYLSFDQEGILVGNMISDFVKGNKQFAYPPMIQKGIQLHREIDAFTDEHPVTRTAKQVFREDYRLYSGAFMDIAYDYFLANDETEFSPDSLYAFSQKTYAVLDRYSGLLPQAFRQLFYYMKQQNWLYNYRTASGIYKSFAGLVRRASYLTDSRPAERIFQSNTERLKEYYRLFWKELKPFAAAQLEQLVR